MRMNRRAPVLRQTAVMTSFGIVLVPEMSIHLRTMDRLVATGRPARSLNEAGGMISVADKNSAIHGLLLKMTLQTERRIPLR